MTSWLVPLRFPKFIKCMCTNYYYWWMVHLWFCHTELYCLKFINCDAIWETQPHVAQGDFAEINKIVLKLLFSFLFFFFFFLFLFFLFFCFFVCFFFLFCFCFCFFLFLFLFSFLLLLLLALILRNFGYRYHRDKI